MPTIINIDAIVIPDRADTDAVADIFSGARDFILGTGAARLARELIFDVLAVLRTNTGEIEKRAAHRWISDASDDVCGLAWCCTALDLDAEATRRALLEIVNGEREAPVAANRRAGVRTIGAAAHAYTARMAAERRARRTGRRQGT